MTSWFEAGWMVVSFVKVGYILGGGDADRIMSSFLHILSSGGLGTPKRVVLRKFDMQA